MSPAKIVEGGVTGDGLEGNRLGPGDRVGVGDY